MNKNISGVLPESVLVCFNALVVERATIVLCFFMMPVVINVNTGRLSNFDVASCCI